VGVARGARLALVGEDDAVLGTKGRDAGKEGWGTVAPFLLVDFGFGEG